MATKKPLAIYAGKVKELQSGDSVSGAGLTTATTEYTTGGSSTYTVPAGAKSLEIVAGAALPALKGAEVPAGPLGASRCYTST
jgi:hypothetical protein